MKKQLSAIASYVKDNKTELLVNTAVLVGTTITCALAAEWIGEAISTSNDEEDLPALDSEANDSSDSDTSDND